MNSVTMLSGNGAVQAKEAGPQKHLLVDLLRPGSGQVTPVSGECIDIFVKHNREHLEHCLN